MLKNPVMFKPATMILTDIENHPIFVNPLSVTAALTDGKGMTHYAECSLMRKYEAPFLRRTKKSA